MALLPENDERVALHSNPYLEHTFADPQTHTYLGTIDFGDAYLSHPAFDMRRWNLPAEREALLRKYPSQPSNGMRQRVILARALLFHTPLILLDEPTVGLDPVHTQSLLDLLRGLLRTRGQTIILTDHMAAEMEVVAERIAILSEGEIVMLGTPSELRASLKDVTVIEVHTEAMDLPAIAPPSLILATAPIERPGALGVRTWRVYVQKSPDALQTVLDWIIQPQGRVIFLAETVPNLQDVLALLRFTGGSKLDTSTHFHVEAVL